MRSGSTISTAFLVALVWVSPEIAGAQDTAVVDPEQGVSTEVPQPEPLESNEATDEPSSLVPGIADERLADVDDGIDEIFAAWASERLFSGSPAPLNSTLMLLTEIGMRFGITSDSRARVDWGFAYSSSHVVGPFMDTTTSTMTYDAQVERVEARNPTLTFEWAPLIGTARFSFGLGVAAPTAAGENLPTDLAHASTYWASDLTHEMMIMSAGGLAPWRYRRERFGVFLPISFTFPIDRMTVAIEGAAAIAAPVTGAGRSPVTGDLQADVQLSGDLMREVRLGARFGISVLGIGASGPPVTGLPTSSMMSTIVQPSFTGYVRVRVDPGFLIASVLADLGGDYGLNSNGGVWSVTLGGGAAIP